MIHQVSTTGTESRHEDGNPTKYSKRISNHWPKYTEDEETTFKTLQSSVRTSIKTQSKEEFLSESQMTQININREEKTVKPKECQGAECQARR